MAHRVHDAFGDGDPYAVDRAIRAPNDLDRCLITVSERRRDLEMRVLEILAQPPERRGNVVSAATHPVYRAQCHHGIAGQRGAKALLIALVEGRYMLLYDIDHADGTCLI